MTTLSDTGPRSARCGSGWEASAGGVAISGSVPAALAAAAQAVTDAASGSAGGLMAAVGSAEVDIGPRSPSRRNKAHVWFQDDCSVLS